jgi:hypothetical protein
MRGKSEDQSVGVPKRPKIASARSTTERELARESKIGQLTRARAWRASFSWVLFFGVWFSGFGPHGRER